MESKLEIGAPEEFRMQAILVENVFAVLPIGILNLTALICSLLVGTLTHLLFGAPASSLVFLFMIVLTMAFCLYLMLNKRRLISDILSHPSLG